MHLFSCVYQYFISRTSRNASDSISVYDQRRETIQTVIANSVGEFYRPGFKSVERGDHLSLIFAFETKMIPKFSVELELEQRAGRQRMSAVQSSKYIFINTHIRNRIVYMYKL